MVPTVLSWRIWSCPSRESHFIITAPILHHFHWSWYCFRSVSIPAIIIRRHFHRKRIKPVTVWRAAIVLCFFLHRHVALVKVNQKKKRQTTVIQQQSASRVQLPSLSAAKERKHGKRRQSARRTKQTKTRAHAESDDSSGQVSVQSGEGNSDDR